ncbi:uncharacterized protein LOC131636648 [Vicia villosa]|uniref:uncharacterized protein LOC131636648 n=1 Tax=Vicia villosa TaxID=3911 RepID=UPI00273B03D8|nr:uncharacterized protein LOC131636648 [Vicia villosa]XP_058763240.1 uncharacterized protein LOC131636648 [Vicia villosa]
MYKPFVTCDDPKGVVECGTIRRYRSSSHKMKDKTKSRKTVENLETNKEVKVEKVLSRGSSGREFDSSSLQLVEVSRGAEKLNKMIKSWSSGLRYDAKSEDIAKDLLKGALDLQESLEMLRKVQDASSSIARSKKKQEEERERSRIDAKVNDRIRMTHSNQFVEYNSAYGSSSSCREELKKVIKESLVRQNLFQSTSASEGLDSASAAFPSTSSSQSSVVWYDKLSDSSSSPNFPKREKSTNLVAKLMGLEQVPSRTFPSVMQKQTENQKIVNQKRPVFEIDTPKIRKHSSVVEKINPERQKTLREILETTHFNGLLKNSPIREHKLHNHVNHSNDLQYNEFGELPPIVLMKPRRASYEEFVETYEPVPQEELSFRNLKAKGAPSKTFNPMEGSTTNMRKDMEENLSKRVIREERPKRVKEVFEIDVKEIKPVENKKVQKASQRLQASETVDEKTKVKNITSSRKPLEKEVSKAKAVTKAQDQGEIRSSSEKLRKPRSVSRIDKNETPSRKSTSSNSNTTIAKPKTQKVNSSKDLKKSPMKKQRSIDLPEAAKPLDEQLRQEDGMNINVSCKEDCAEIKIITTITEDLVMEHEVDTFSNKTKDISEGQNSLGDNVLMPSCEDENDAIHAEEPHDTTSIGETDFMLDKNTSELKYFLLTSKSFIDHAKGLFNLDVGLGYPKILTKIESKGITNSRLYLDCANELAERKSLQESSSQVVHPLLLTCVGNSRLQISFGSLVEEVYNAIENLTSYSEDSETKLLLDNICAMLERDMKCNSRMINGIWNYGWKHGFSCDEVEQVVNEVENMVLDGLIEEIIVNL